MKWNLKALNKQEVFNTNAFRIELLFIAFFGIIITWLPWSEMTDLKPTISNFWYLISININGWL